MNNNKFNQFESEERSFGLIVEAIRYHSIEVLNVLLDNKPAVMDIADILMWEYIIKDHETSIEVLKIFLEDPRVCSVVDPYLAITHLFNNIKDGHRKSQMTSLLLNCEKVRSKLSDDEKKICEELLGG